MYKPHSTVGLFNVTLWVLLQVIETITKYKFKITFLPTTRQSKTDRYDPLMSTGNKICITEHSMINN